jgi:palmitoyl transferase
VKFTILTLAICLMPMTLHSQDQGTEKENQITTETTGPKQNFARNWWESVKNNFSLIYHEGQNDLYLSGYAYHDRNTYTKEKLSELNEGAYGSGIGRSKININGNTEMLYAMTHLDSHKDVQAEVGYAWVKKFNVFSDFRLGIGYTAFIVSRSDIAGRIPVPFALPLATMDIKNVSINAVIIPKLNNGINNGNVVFFFAKFSWDKNKDIL